MRLNEFVYEPATGVHIPPDGIPRFAYSDGSDVEAYLFQVVAAARDKSSLSFELRNQIKDWPSRYHLSPLRTNLLRGFSFLDRAVKVLEVGAGCGAITRYLGERCGQVYALEGSYRRAQIARQRCSDLENVRVYVANAFDVSFSGEYDVVTLIGVLEYAPLYFNPAEFREEGCLELLRLAHSALTEDGVLILAIENKLGLKYWAGAREDHSGRLFDGLYDYPRPAGAAATPITFSKAELRHLLTKAGFASMEFYYPFPDYKLPDTIIAETDDGAYWRLYLHNWVITPFEDYSGQRSHLMHEGFILRTLSKAGLLGEFANSFLVLASKHELDRVNEQWVAIRFSVERRRCYSTVTSLRLSPEPVVVKEKLCPHEQTKDEPIKQVLASSRWQPGDLLSYMFYEALVDTHSCLPRLTALVRTFADHLITRYGTGKRDESGYPLVNGQAFDCVPWNIVVGPDGAWTYIDQEWECPGYLPADFVLFRGLFHFFERESAYVSPTGGGAALNTDTLIINLIKSVFPQYTEDRHGENVQREKLLQQLISSENASDVTGHGSTTGASIIIPVYNNWQYTRWCLLSLEAAGYREKAEVIVVDNGSTDETQAQLQSEFPWIKVLRNEQNRGFGAACNQAAQVAKGKYLVFLNNDTIPQPGWLEALVALAESDHKVGAVGSKLVYPNGRLQEAGAVVFSDGSCWNYGRGGNPKDPRFDFVRRVDYCSGACLLVSSELFRRIGGFDPRFEPAYYEDVDLCFAVRAMGFEVYYQPEAVVVHVEGATAGTDLTRGFKRYQVINRHKFVDKWKNVLQKQYPPDPRRVRLASNRAPGRRILVVDPFLPMYDRASGSRRLFEILKVLVAQGHAVTFIARNGLNQERYAEELKRLGIEVYSTDPEKMRALGYSVSAPPIDLKRLMAESNYDLAWLSFYDVAEQYLPGIRELSPQTRIFIDTVDVHFVREERQAQLYQDKRLRRKAAETKLRELAIYQQADALITVSEEDRRHLLAELPEAVVYVVPNLHQIEDDIASFEEREGLVFVGNFRHPPNADAIFYFVREIWPRVRERIPGISFTIVGDAPPPEIEALAGDGITVTGYVPDVLPYLKAHRVAVAPLRYGAGLKGKIGEALGAGTPVVTTSIGAEGMQLGPRQDVLLVADAPNDFAEAVIRAYTDKALWQRLSHGGRAFVRERYTPEVVGKLIEAMLNHDLKQQKRDAPSSASAGQMVSVSHPPAGSQPTLSIIIPVWKGAAVTYRCLDAIIQHTRIPYEVIIVDNGADAETRSMIEAAAARQESNFRIIRNRENCGYPYACNQGLAVAKGSYIVVMNNDVLVTPHWASRMMAAFAVDPAIGIVGPRTNFASGTQAVNGYRYEDQTLDAWSEAWYRQNAGNLREVTRLVGFLWMMKREVVEAIGGFDPLFGIGNFEDDDYCLRAQLAGYKLVVADDVFVYHYGSYSFKSQPEAYVRLLQTNRMLFAAKWDLNFSGNRYRPEEVLVRGADGVDPGNLRLPLGFQEIFSPNIAPLDVGCGAADAILCIPDPSDSELTYLEVVRRYLAAVPADAGLALIIRVEPPTEEWLARVISSLREAARREGLDLERDDIVIEARSIPSARRGEVYRAACYFVSLPGVRQEALAREARACGLSVMALEDLLFSTLAGIRERVRA